MSVSAVQAPLVSVSAASFPPIVLPQVSQLPDAKKQLPLPARHTGVHAAFSRLQEKLWAPIGKQVYRDRESFGAVLQSHDVLRELTIALEGFTPQLLSVTPKSDQESLTKTMYNMRGGDKSQAIETLFPARFVLTSYDIFYGSRVGSLSAQLTAYPKSKEMLGYAWHVMTALEAIGNELVSESPNADKFSEHVRRLAKNWPSYAVHYNQYLDVPIADKKLSPASPREDAAKKKATIEKRQGLYYQAIAQGLSLDPSKGINDYKMAVEALASRRDKIIAHNARIYGEAYSDKLKEILGKAFDAKPEHFYRAWFTFSVAASQLLSQGQDTLAQAAMRWRNIQEAQYGKEHFIDALKFLDQVLGQVKTD
jgi:hypothetical protein